MLSVEPRLASVKPRLLVSVRTLAEAQLACHAGVDILDLKEPNLGSLGRLSAAELTRISDAVPHPQSLTAALGEVPSVSIPHYVFPLPARLDAVKLGTAGLMHHPEGLEAWCEARRRWEEASGRALTWIAVAYADSEAAASPPWPLMLELACRENCPGLLIDTYSKSGPRLTQLFTPAELREICRAAHSAGKFIALAGRLTPQDATSLLACSPDVIAVRSAVCRSNDRQQPLDPAAIRNLQVQLGEYGR